MLQYINSAATMSSRPSTPSSRIPPALSNPSTPQTGSWKHPRFDEIVKRQRASVFSDSNLRRILYNVGGLIALWFLSHFVQDNLPTVYRLIVSFRPYSTYIQISLQIMMGCNILMACLPLLRPKDDLSDIPLTPAQRKLLGLPPSSAPPTPGSQYATPPRYTRTPTPLKDSSGAGYSGSPLSSKGGAVQGSPRDSAYSPNASPLLHKAVGGMASIRRSSYGSASPLGPGAQKVWLDGQSTPSPSLGKGSSSVQLNSKWLYERGRGSPGNSSLFS